MRTCFFSDTYLLSVTSCSWGLRAFLASLEGCSSHQEGATCMICSFPKDSTSKHQYIGSLECCYNPMLWIWWWAGATDIQTKITAVHAKGSRKHKSAIWSLQGDFPGTKIVLTSQYDLLISSLFLTLRRSLFPWPSCKMYMDLPWRAV